MSLLIGQPLLAYERGGAWGTGRFPTLSRRGRVGERWFPPRPRAKGERCSTRLFGFRCRFGFVVDGAEARPQVVHDEARGRIRARCRGDRTPAVAQDEERALLQLDLTLVTSCAWELERRSDDSSALCASASPVGSSPVAASTEPSARGHRALDLGQLGEPAVPAPLPAPTLLLGASATCEGRKRAPRPPSHGGSASIDAPPSVATVSASPSGTKTGRTEALLLAFERHRAASVPVARTSEPSGAARQPHT
jgi:hypothetical protein